MRCYSLKEFPDEVNNLISLRHVYFDKSMKFPFGMGQLTDLRTLPHFSVGKERGRGIEDLDSLNQLKGELTLSKLEHVRDRDKARKAKLEDKKNLRHLRFVWTEDMSTTNNNDEDVLEGLQPHSEFESLVIEHFKGAKFPSWMMSRSLPLNNLKKIHLRRCNKCEGVPTLGHLPNLQHLRIDRMAELKCIGADFYGYNLVYNATRSRKETTTLFPALKQLSISECRELIEWMEAPKLSTEVFPCLEELHILNCPKLRNAPSHFPLLKDLWISSCDNVQPLKNITSRLTSLTSLTIDLNKKITSLPKGMLESNKNLTSVEILSCEKLACIAPNVLGCCTSLQKLHVYDCKKLRRLPDGIDTLPLLEKMTIRECPRLEFIPMTHGMASLRKLHIDSCGGLSGLPSGLQYCTSLQALSIMGCGNLTVIPVTHDLSSLRTLKIGDCEGLSCLPSGLEHFSSLQELSVWNCPIVTSIPISNGVPFTSLQVLEIENCMELSSFPALEFCPSLRKLMIRNCPKLAFISALSLTNPLPSSRSENFTSTSLDSLEYLSIRSCSNLHSIPDLDSFTSLRQLWIHNCERLEIRATSLCVSLEELKLTSLPKPESIPSLDNLTSLCMVAIYDCGNLKIFPRGLHCLTRLKTLTIGGFSEELDCFPDFPILSRLKRLTLRGWPKLKSLPQQIQHFTSLTHLCIMSFDGVEALPDWLGNLTYLWQLEIVNCKNLMYLPTVKAMQRLTNLLNLEIRCCPFLGERCTAETGSEWHKVSHILTFKVVDSESCRVLKLCDAST
ncbi:hypothetical protein C1H46_031401 [Malus baccata]|uniref:R13L1/DRL21-like LRR repeat region domain-containing protein n=1 Tax=Malus baccata TaxID=106549 RepID=A0A540L982_MALBA|nr:hypothetical protein C1H46_031401 [Malus baccata]